MKHFTRIIAATYSVFLCIMLIACNNDKSAINKEIAKTGLSSGEVKTPLLEEKHQAESPDIKDKTPLPEEESKKTPVKSNEEEIALIKETLKAWSEAKNNYSAAAVVACVTEETAKEWADSTREWAKNKEFYLMNKGYTKKDMEKSDAYLMAKQLESMFNVLKMMEAKEGKKRDFTMTFVSAKIEGDKAIVRVRIAGGFQGNEEMVKEKNKWKFTGKIFAVKLLEE